MLEKHLNKKKALKKTPSNKLIKEFNCSLDLSSKPRIENADEFKLPNNIKKSDRYFHLENLINKINANFHKGKNASNTKKITSKSAFYISKVSSSQEKFITKGNRKDNLDALKNIK